MTRFQDINENIDWFKLRTKQGYISISILRHFEIYSRFDYYRKTGANVSTSVFNVSEDFRINERSVYKVLTNMQEEL